MSALGVIVDGQALPDDEARALWARFSAWMEEHKGDLAGFAQQEGLASVHPATQQGRAVLVASKTAPQGPYANAREVRAAPAAKGARGAAAADRSGGRSSGSGGHHHEDRARPGGRGTPGKASKRRA